MAESSSPAPAPTQQFQRLSATYSSPTNKSFIQSQRLPALATPKPADRVEYLTSLREAVATMQEEINKNLTARMEEDKAREAIVVNGTKANLNESKEEDNYGEEVVGED